MQDMGRDLEDYLTPARWSHPYSERTFGSRAQALSDLKERMESLTPYGPRWLKERIARLTRSINRQKGELAREIPGIHTMDTSEQHRLIKMIETVLDDEAALAVQLAEKKRWRLAWKELHGQEAEKEGGKKR